MPPNLPRASTEGNCQSKCSKQMPLYEPAENPRTKTSRWEQTWGRAFRYLVLPEQKGERGSPAEMRESSVQRSNVRLLKHLYRHRLLTDAFVKVSDGLWYYMLFQCSELHICMFTWLRAGEALTSLASIPSKTMSVARSQSRGSHATSTLASNWSEGSSEQGPTDETFARGSSESPCRAVRLVNFPRDGHAPSASATGSDEFPPKSSGALRMCYCVNKLRRCFHYDVDSDFVLHSNCRCSENVDVDTDKVWPVVIMCRRCSPFPEL